MITSDWLAHRAFWQRFRLLRTISLVWFSEDRVIRSRSLEPKDLQALLEGLSGSPDLSPFRLVDPLKKHDQERNSDLVHTLEVYFASGANASEAADRLLLHRNSIPYRLERVRELTGLDYRDYRARLAMQLGLLALDKKEEADETERP